MAITINTVSLLPSGHWRINVTSNGGETHLLKMPRGEKPPRDADVREEVRKIEDCHTERRRLDTEERARLQALQARLKDFRQDKLNAAQTKVLLNDLIGELRDALRG